MKNKTTFLLMYISFFIYSLSGLFSKIASLYDTLSVPHLLCLFGIIIVLGIYAILWQQVIKKLDLSVAMSNKPVVLVFGTLWAIFFFDEKVSIKFFIGFALIVFGLFVIGVGDE